MPTIVQDLLLFGDEFGDLDKLIHLTPVELRQHVMQILEDKKVVDYIANAVSDGLVGLSEHGDMVDILERMRDTGPPKNDRKKGKGKDGKK